MLIKKMFIIQKSAALLSLATEEMKSVARSCGLPVYEYAPTSFELNYVPASSEIMVTGQRSASVSDRETRRAAHGDRTHRKVHLRADMGSC